LRDLFALDSLTEITQRRLDFLGEDWVPWPLPPSPYSFSLKKRERERVMGFRSLLIPLLFSTNGLLQFGRKEWELCYVIKVLGNCSSGQWSSPAGLWITHHAMWWDVRDERE
jgi:hypothetical protein